MISIPTLNDLYTQVLTDLETEYGISISRTGKVFLRAVAAVQAAKLKLYYLTIGALQKNIFVDTADPESLGGTLERFGRVKLGRNPFQATSAQYNIQVSGSVGATINALTTFKSDDSSLHPGMLYILYSYYNLVNISYTITVRALTSGEASRLNLSDTLTATQPIILVNSSAYVASIVVDPLDAESIEDYRQAVIDSYRLEPQGGAAIDYRVWSKDAQGVKQSYPYAHPTESNEINVYVEATIADSTDGKGTPTAGILTDVAAVIEFDPDVSMPLDERGRRPLGVYAVNVLPVTIIQVDITIQGYQGATPAIELEITAAITAAVNLIRPYVSGADILANKNNFIDINKIIGVIITTTPGAVFTTPDLNINSSPVSTYTFIDGNIPYLNSVSYT